MKDREWEFGDRPANYIVSNWDRRLEGRKFFLRAVLSTDLEDGPSRSNPWTSLDIDTEGEE